MQSPEGYFTIGIGPEQYSLPHPRLGLPVILFIRRVLLRAFEKLRERGFALGTEPEDRITEQLYHILENDLRQTGEIEGFDTKSYEPVTRHAQVTNYNNEKMKKTPDLSFKLRNDSAPSRLVVSSHDALFVECKPIDKEHFAGSDYCDDGLIRFINGDYAWAMQEGMMLAYVRDGRSIANHLIPAMAEPARNDFLATLQQPEPCLEPGATECDKAETVHTSHHRRDFTWLDGKGRATAITVYHLWHRCT